METSAILTLAGVCLGIALTGLIAAAIGPGQRRARQCLCIVYVALIGMVGLPLVKAFAPAALINYMPLLLIMLLWLPPAFYHYVRSKAATAPPAPIPWRDLVLPAVGGAVGIGYWLLPAQAKDTMFISGALPPGLWPAVLALLTFALILIWLVASGLYLVATLRQLAAYRRHIRQLYSDVESRDLRWINVVMILLVLIWAATAFALAQDNLADGHVLMDRLVLALIAAGLLVLSLFAPQKQPADPQSPPDDPLPDPVPDPKYARSALTSAHAAKLAQRIATAMQKDALYLDPTLSLHKLAQHVGALPNQVSQTLNQEIGKSFFDYVAHWRITASQPRILADDASILTIALEVGFNTRSTFYKAFKRETGMTPQAYRQRHGKTG